MATRAVPRSKLRETRNWPTPFVFRSEPEPPPPAYRTMSLPPRWEWVRARIAGLGKYLGCKYEQEWLLLLRWRRLLFEKHLAELPAPWVFASEDGVIELEWEVGPRLLTLRLCPGNDPYQYSSADENLGDAGDHEGAIDVASVESLLLWLLGR